MINIKYFNTNMRLIFFLVKKHGSTARDPTPCTLRAGPSPSGLGRAAVLIVLIVCEWCTYAQVLAEDEGGVLSPAAGVTGTQEPPSVTAGCSAPEQCPCVRLPAFASFRSLYLVVITLAVHTHSGAH